MLVASVLLLHLVAGNTLKFKYHLIEQSATRSEADNRKTITATYNYTVYDSVHLSWIAENVVYITLKRGAFHLTPSKVF